MLTWILGVAIAAIVLALMLYFMAPARGVKLPAIVLATVGGMAAGGVLGLLAAVVYGDAVHKNIFAEQYRPGPMPGAGSAPGSGPAAPAKQGGGGSPGGGMGGGAMPSSYPGMDQAKKSMAGGGGGGPGMFGRGPSPKTQLAALVGKLDQLTRKPLAVSLDKDHRAKVREQLQGLADSPELSADEAKKRLDTLLDIVKDQRETLEAAGFRWPGAAFAPPTDTPNPFKDETQGKRLASLLETLGKEPVKP